MEPATLFKTSKRSYFRSSSFVMALLFTVMLGGASGILGYSGYYLNRTHFIMSIEQILETEYSYLDSAFRKNQLEEVLRERLGNNQRIYYITNQHGEYVSGNIDAYPSHVELLDQDIIYFTQEGTNDFFAAKSYKLGAENQILIGSNMSDLIYTERVILWMGAVTILLMMLVIIVSYLISTFVVDRTNHIADIARNITQTGDLSQRIIIDSRWDDLSHMAYVLNHLLAKIEELMDGIRRVADNIAHDLRTPLTRLRNNLDTLSQEVQGDKFDKLIAEADHILSTFQAVLRISKIENAPSKMQFRQCDLKKILCDVVELYEPLLLDKSISLKTNMPDFAPYFGDVNLLFQMCANLVDNALKFTPVAGMVSISLLQIENNSYELLIEDTGIGISDEDIKYVFDRFYRGEKSRSSEGNGLGLSMVWAVVQLHQGQIYLEKPAQGLRVRINL